MSTLSFSNVIDEIKSGNGKQGDHLNKIEEHTRNSRRHLLESKNISTELLNLQKTIRLLDIADMSQQTDMNSESSDMLKIFKNAEDQGSKLISAVTNSMTGLTKEIVDAIALTIKSPHSLTPVVENNDSADDTNNLLKKEDDKEQKSMFRELIDATKASRNAVDKMVKTFKSAAKTGAKWGLGLLLIGGIAAAFLNDDFRNAVSSLFTSAFTSIAEYLGDKFDVSTMDMKAMIVSAGLSSVILGAAGMVLGGPVGAVVGTMLGIAISSLGTWMATLVGSKLGVTDAQQSAMIKMAGPGAAIGMLIGGSIGMIGGPGGVFLGAIAGVMLGLAIASVIGWMSEWNYEGSTLQKAVNKINEVSDAIGAWIDNMIMSIIETLPAPIQRFFGTDIKPEVATEAEWNDSQGARLQMGKQLQTGKKFTDEELHNLYLKYKGEAAAELDDYFVRQAKPYHNRRPEGMDMTPEQATTSYAEVKEYVGLMADVNKNLDNIYGSEKEGIDTEEPRVGALSLSAQSTPALVLMSMIVDAVMMSQNLNKVTDESSEIAARSKQSGGGGLSVVDTSDKSTVTNISAPSIHSGSSPAAHQLDTAKTQSFGLSN